MPIRTVSAIWAILALGALGTGTPAAALEKGSSSLAQCVLAAGTSDAGALSATCSDELSSAVLGYARSSGKTDVDEVLQGVAQAAVQSVERDVQNLAAELQKQLALADLLRNDIASFRDELTDWPDESETRQLRWHDAEGGEQVGNLDASDASATLEQLEMTLESVGSMTQMLQLELQDAMQKQQQAYQLLSNMMKMYRDTAKRLIANLR